MIAVVDYGMGNLRSVEKALAHVGADVRVTHDPEVIQKCQRLVVPGVGAFDHAANELKRLKLYDLIRDVVTSGRPYLGLCLGLQLLFEGSDEGEVAGWGLIKGRVKRFDVNLKVPHMGWNEVRFKEGTCPIWKNIKNSSYFYFVHSFAAHPSDVSVSAGLTNYQGEFTSAVWQDNIFATQFHPEKSQADGLQLLKNFLESDLN